MTTTTSYRTLPSNTSGGVGAQTNYSTYNLDIGPLTTHLTDANQQQSTRSNNVNPIQQQPRYYLRDKYDEQLAYNQNHVITSQTPRSTIPNQSDKRYATGTISNNTNPTYEPSVKRHQYQTSYSGTALQHPPGFQTNRGQSEHYVPKQSGRRRRSLSNSDNSYDAETTIRRNNPSLEIKTNKSNEMRTAAIKQREDTRDQKQNNKNSFSMKKKLSTQTTYTPPTNGKEYDNNRSQQNVKQSYSVPSYRKNRRDDYETEDNTSSVDENNNDLYTQNKSGKRRVITNNIHKKNSSLPPVRRGQGPPYYDPAVTYPLPHGHPLRGRFTHNDGRQHDQQPGQYDEHHRHSYEDVYEGAPPPDSHNRCKDCEKRRTKSGSEINEDEKETAVDRRGTYKNPNYTNRDNEEDIHQHGLRRSNEPIHNDEQATYENSHQEKNDDSKKRPKPSIHDALYSQHALSTDSYLENQRRRALRDTQGYYFPYKKYTLRDYKDLRKTESQFNPYGSSQETNLDRKERARKRLQYAAQIERPVVDISGEEYRTPRDISPRKPFNVNNSQSNDAEKVSKRDRALEYVKAQTMRQRHTQTSKNKFNKQDPTEQYINSLFPEVDDDDDDAEVNRQHHKNN